MAGLTNEGFEAKTYAEVLADIEARQLAAFGADFDVSPEQPVGAMNGIVANAARELWEALAAVYAAGDADGATGQSLTQLAALTGSVRRGLRKGRVPLVLTVSAGATVPAGSVARVSTQPTNRWVTLTDAVNATSGSLAITVQAEQETAGPLPAAATAINEIATPVTGWVSVSNTEPASPGLAAETDAVLRRRREVELQGAGTTPAEAIRAALSRVPLVSEVVVWENPTDAIDADGRPPHSVEAMVTGGDATAIAAVLWEAKARGIATFGTATPVTVADAQGLARIVHFTRPTDVLLWVKVDAVVDPRRDPGDAAIAAAVRAVVAAVGSGGAVLRAPIICAALDVAGVRNVPRVRLGRAFGAESGIDLTLGARERPTSLGTTVTVTRV